MIVKFLMDEGGGPAIEFALVAAFMAVVLPTMFDIATLTDNHMKLSSGLRAGTQFAIKYPSDAAGIKQSIVTASGLPEARIAVNMSQICECAGISTVCTSSCSYGVQLAKFNSINVVYTIGNELNLQNFYPSTISKTLTVRTQ